jgi:hypothetical protein
MLSEQQLAERLETVQDALGSQRLEGLEPDAMVIQDAERWARGEITIDTAVSNYKARLLDEVLLRR